MKNWLIGTALLAVACGGSSETTPDPSASPAPTAVEPAGAPATADEPTEPKTPGAREVLRIEDVGLKTPESVLYDEKEDVYLVSNINGQPLDVDRNGFVSKVSPEGEVIELEWLKSGKGKKRALNAPKGLAIAAGKVYVADINRVVTFNHKSGKFSGAERLKASFLNDLATGPADKVYVSDSGMKAGKAGFEPTGSDSIFALRPTGQMIKTPELKGPNGLYHDGTSLWAVSFGANQLYRIDSDGKKADVVELPKGGLDGIVALPGGDVLISSWEAETIYRGPTSGPFEPVITGVKAPADIGYDTKRNRVLVPLFMDNAIVVYELEQR